MSFSLTWFPNVLGAAGLKVAPVEGWETRGRGDVGEIHGVICHHTGGAASGNMPSLRTLIDGRSDLPGPLAQLGLGRDGTYYVIAAGRCNHAGTGVWNGLTNANRSFIGIEAENSGRADDRWLPVQIAAYQHGVAAILKHIEKGPDFCAGHKEYALPAGRKIDPNLDMFAFRSAVAAVLDGSAQPLRTIPASDAMRRPTLRRGASGEIVSALQRALGLKPDGNFGPITEGKVRAFQREHALVADGIVGPTSWGALYKVAKAQP